MSDRIKGFVVTLDSVLRDDDAEEIRRAIGAIRGVANVKPSVDRPEDAMNREMVRHDLSERLWRALREEGR